MSPQPALDRPAKTPWRLVILLGALTAFAPMSIDMYLPSLPALAQSLHTTPHESQATLATFFAGLAIGQFLYGPASDRMGRKGPLMAGIVIYVIASAACALAPNIEVLIAARFVQALGGCAGQVVARAVVRDKFDHQDSARVLSLLTLVMGLAPILAPLAGGAVLQVAGWRAIFWVLTGFGAVMAVWAWFELDESRSAETAAHARGEHPVRAYLSLLGHRRLNGYVLAGALNGASLFTYISASPDLLIGTYKVAPQNFGWIFGANAAGLIGASQLNRLLLRNHRSDRVLGAASTVSLGCAVLLAGAAVTGIGGMYGVLAGIFLIMASFGFMQANTLAGALSIDPRRAGSISALMGGASFAVGAVAAGVAGALHDGTARPMALVILVCLAGSWAALRGLALKKA